MSESKAWKSLVFSCAVLLHFTGAYFSFSIKRRGWDVKLTGDPERFLLAWAGYILSAIILQTVVSFDSASHPGASHAKRTVELLHKFWFHCAIRACLSWRQAQTLVSCCFRMTAAVECFVFWFFPGGTTAKVNCISEWWVEVPIGSFGPLGSLCQSAQEH